MVPVDNSQLVPMQSMCAANDLKVLCIIRDLTNPQWQQCKITVNLPASTTARELCDEVARQANYEGGTFSLVWQRGGQHTSNNVLINDLGEQNLLDIGMLTNKKKNMFELGDKDGKQPVPIEVGATGVTVTPDDNTSTSAVNDEDSSPVIASPVVENSSTSTEYGYGLYSSAVISKSDTGFVGLVNQAMTCYLNSLLQSLYMTPEFRNALYNWEYDEMSEDPGKSIPYQLQRLFVQLQTSKKRAVETTDVTKSFGWDSSEAWQQHDVQELCRVMFDALEKKWKNTDQSNLINRLYQGQMKDYVKCLECGYESARKDAFLDIPLVIRPFGATQANGSVEEALRAFVTPETLDESNQYFCEKCDKKCDAHKGFKFINFPYMLTMQLKRFDFDYSTMHRIKLNDKMTFPEILDLNDFIDGAEKPDERVAKVEIESQTDSGAENEDSCPSNQSSECTDECIDEGIDVQQAATAAANDRNEKKRCERGPYAYELFSIMVHSGTAAGGHYYAYIKSFTDGQWYCYNDQNVICVTYDDIRKTYGGSNGSYRGYYSSSYASSTNAYMLMYRQIDTENNKNFYTLQDLPTHIQQLSQSIIEDEENEKRQREIERNTCKIKLFSVHPLTGKSMETRLEVHKDKTLSEATEIAYEVLGFDKILPLNQCRLVKYDEFHESLEMSYDNEEETPMGQLLGGVKSSYMFDLMMETRLPSQQFQTYYVGGVTIKLYEVDLDGENIRNPISMRSYLNMTISEFKNEVSLVTGLPLEDMRVVLEKYYNDLKVLTVPNKSLKAEGFLKSNKVFVEGQDTKDAEVPFPESRLHQLLDRFANTIRLFVSLPPALTDAKSSSSDIGSGCASSISPSPSEKYSDLNVDMALLSPNKAPTPSPTGSSSTLSDDHPLDKNHMNLLGSETDSGVVSLSESRIALLGDDNDSELSPYDEQRGEPDGAPSMERTGGQGDAHQSLGFSDNFTLDDVTHSEATQSGQMPLQLSQEAENSEPSDNSFSTSQTMTSSTIPSQTATTRSSTTASTASDASFHSCQAPSGSSSSCEECQRLKHPMQEGTAPSSSLSLSSIDSHLTVSSCNTTPSEMDGDHKLNSGQGETLTGLAYDDCNGDSEEEIYENTQRHKQKVWYFKAEAEAELEGGRVLPVYLDKRMTLRAFKRAMEPHVGVSMHNFKIYRVYANNQEFESFRLNETLQTYSDDGKVIIKLGRALKKGEYRVKVFQLLVNESEPCKHLLDWVFAKGMTVLQSKKEIQAELKSKCNIDIPLDRLRLRKKAWKNPGVIYMNSQIYDEDIPIFTNWEVFVELLTDPDPMQSLSDLVLLTRRWRPTEFKLDPFREVVIKEGTAEELKAKISELSDIPVDRVEFAKGKGTFPCEISLLEMQTDLEWDPQVTSLNSYPLYISDDGAVVYYRDSEEELMELTEDQKRTLQKKESARLAKTGQRINYSPRKERALKIYTDNPPPYSAVAD